jgi:SAM-dependent methyltransferase
VRRPSPATGGPPAFGGFSDVDGTGTPGEYATLLDAVRAQPDVQDWKARTLGALEPAPGAVLLDVGCGTGEDVRALGRLVAPGGRAIGVDASAALVAEARRRGAGDGAEAVEFLRGDAGDLPLPDRSADGARVERVLQHLGDPGRAVAEMARVVRPGGRVVAAEPDWGTFVVDSDDAEVAALVEAAAARRFRSPGVGRTLRRLLAAAGLEGVEVAARSLVITDGPAAATVFDVRGAALKAVEDGDLDAGRAAAWIDGLGRAAAAGRGLTSLTAFVAVGRVPGAG